MGCGSTLVPSYEHALGALGAVAAGFALVALLAVMVWGFTGVKAAYRYAVVFGSLGATAVGVIFVSLGWTAVNW